MADSACTGNYLYALTTIVNTRDPSENQIIVKLPNSPTMASTNQSQIPLHSITSQAKHTEIFTTLNSIIISIAKLFDDECISTFDKHRFIVRIKKGEGH